MKRKDAAGDPGELRRRAEERLRKNRGGSAAGETNMRETRRLVHELQVHQIELELQNEELQRARAEAEEALARYTELYDLAPVGYLTLGRDEQVRQVNLTGARLLGVERSRLVGKRLGLLVAAEFRPAFKAFLAKVFDSRAKEVCEVVLRSEGAPPITVELTATASATTSASEEGQECRVVAADMTERKELQAAMAQNDRLASMGMLAAGLAHEINNPLSYVIYNVESLAEDLPKLADGMRRCLAELTARVGADGVVRALGSGHQAFSWAMFEDAIGRLREVVGGTQRIKQIMRGLSTFSRVERTELVPVVVQSSIEHALTVAFNEIQYRAQLVRDFAPVPPVLASESKLAQVFLTLLINAAEATDEGHVERNEIRVRTFTSGDQVCVEVSDNGKGIAPEDQPKIFEPFFTTKGVGVRSGLGLFICKNLVTGFGGEMSLASELGKGTRFLIKLPRLPDHWETRGEKAPEQAVTRPQVRGRILVVDDEAGICTLIARILGHDHEVVTASSGKEGQALLEKDGRFDLILCDLMMPSMSGMELHSWLSQQDPELARQIVFISGGAFTSGASEYLAKVENMRIEKPFDFVSLKRVADEFVAAARARRRA